MSKLDERLAAYRPPHPFTPFEVRYTMRTQISLAHPWLNGDALVMYMLLQDILGDEYYDLPRQPLDLSEIVLPLERRYANKVPGGIFASSVSLFEGEHLVDIPPDKAGIFSTTQYKRFASEYLDHLDSNKKIKQNVGYFKAGMVKTPYVHARKVSFHMYGDLQECERLLSRITSLGKDRGRGWGEVMKVEFIPTEEDMSEERDGRAMRPLPYPVVEGRVRTEDCANLTYRAPYWCRANAGICAPPGCPLLRGE